MPAHHRFVRAKLLVSNLQVKFCCLSRIGSGFDEYGLSLYFTSARADVVYNDSIMASTIYLNTLTKYVLLIIVRHEK